MKHYNICIVFSDTGGGHRSASLAIENAIREIASSHRTQSRFNITLENALEKSHWVNHGLVNLYNYLLRYHQSWMKYYYSLIQTLRPDRALLCYWLVWPYIRNLFEKTNPDVVVSVHPMINQCLAWGLKDSGLSPRVKLITVVTDPNEGLWKAWACRDADLIFVPNDLARNQLVSWGVSPQYIKVAGMPVHPDFLRPPGWSKETFLKKLGLDASHQVICINSGWAGGGNMLSIFKYLCQLPQHLQVIFICGHNQELYQAVCAEAKSTQHKVAVLPFCENMPELMAACDLMVTKAGGLTTYQAIARRLPIAFDVITDPMPQEQGTAQMLIEQGLAMQISHPKDIAGVVARLEEFSVQVKEALPVAHSLDQVMAVYDIARMIIKACDPDCDLVAEPATTSEALNELLV